MRTFTPHELKSLTLEDIQRMKDEVLHEIEQQKEDIVLNAKQITAPYHGIGGSGLIGSLRTAFAVFSGISTGIRLMKSIRKVFR